MSDEEFMEVEKDYNKILKGGDYTIIINGVDGAFTYDVYKKDELFFSGGEWSSYEEVIAELSELHNSLRAIFG